ncbi:DNA cytosine methyltransferase [Coprobacillus sp. AF17-11AC]|nr:DNA cytosine methyltransferase [Coprobacillus sp. AF17-17AC]RGG87838.1 DNA cytosine methyltransferase [Coprobacillus sp. AF17-11AC]
MKKKINYVEAFPNLNDKELNEKYALISHSIQLGNISASKKYTNILKTNGIETNNFPKKKEFNDTNNIIFTIDNPKFTFIDLFAGIGGFRIAMQSVGGQCVFSSEWDESAKETYFDNYGEVPFGDITKPEIKALIPDQFDVLCAGFPCQPFSNAGLKKGIEDTRGTLFYHIAEILRDHQPKAVILENVKGLISNDNGKTIQTILRTITRMGYNCNVPKKLIENGPITKLKTECSKMILSAKDYGVPQNRPRIFIVLWRNDINITNFNYPLPDNSKTKLSDILEKNVSSSFTISDKLWEGHQRRKKEHKKKGNGFGYCLFNEYSEYTSTLSRRYYKDGSEILIEQLGKNPRKLTPREAANLQGFPSNFKIPNSKIKAYQQFGNSVAVPVVKRLSEQVVHQILEV